MLGVQSGAHVTVSDKQAQWLAAYALGLAVADNVEDAATDLIEKTDADMELLELARAHLQALDVADPASRRRASELLTEAASLIRRALPPS